jgi:bifunctional DNA-binding transcriptional regulator/antitoxin component of YhaV-PrlF toxin-antitoxin module
MDTITLQMAQRGVLVLPKTLREAYNLQAGDSFTLLDLGGVFVLSPRHSEIDRLAAQIAETLTKRGDTLESVLQSLREQREKYGSQS